MKKFKNKTIGQTIGILGGGQLGRMICLSAHELGFKTVIFTDQKNSPASLVTNQTIVAHYEDKEALQIFAQMSDIVTFEFENIPLSSLQLLSLLVETNPNPDILKITQHRLLEKKFLNSIGVATVDYAEIDSFESLKKSFHDLCDDSISSGPKSVLKTARMGYDGKGQVVLRNESDLEPAWSQAINQEIILEKFCPFESECSVIVARSKSGEISAYEPLTNIHESGILRKSIYPSKLPYELKIEAMDIAKKIVAELFLVGILAVEFFVVKDVVGDKLLVNELAPRPHNSGHLSMNACVTSQFEQLIRAVTGLPLGSTRFHSSGYMENLIGDDIEKLSKFYSDDHAKIHLYGKEEVRDGRKMGHINLIQDLRFNGRQ